MPASAAPPFNPPTVRRQLGHLTLGRGAAALLAGVWLVAAARLLPASDFSDLAVLLALGAVASVLCDAGYGLLVNQIVAERSGIPAGLLGLVVRRRLVLGAGASLIVALAYASVGSDVSLWVPAAYAISILGTTVYSTATAAMRGAGLVGIEALNEVGSRAGILLGGTVCLLLRPSLLMAVTSYAVCDAVSASVVYRAALRRERKDLPMPSGAPLALRRVAPLAFASLLGTLYNRVDVWLLAALGMHPSVAVYAVACRLYESALIPSSAQAAISLRRLHGGGAVAVRRLVREAVNLTAGLTVLLALLAPLLIRVTFGSEFDEAASLLRLLAIALIPSAVVAVVAPLCGVNRPGAFARRVAGALTVNVAINVVAIPSAGAQAAAWATVISSFVLAASLIPLAWAIARDHENERP